MSENISLSASILENILDLSFFTKCTKLGRIMLFVLGIDHKKNPQKVCVYFFSGY